MKKRTINIKLIRIAMAVFIPMFFALIYALWTLGTTTASYSEITRSISYANRMTEFKEKMDYSIYCVVVEGVDIKELENDNDINTVDPYDYIEKAYRQCDILKEAATVDTSEKIVERINKNLFKLEKEIQEFEESGGTEKSFEEKMKFLDEKIYKYTTRLNKRVRDYIENETGNIAAVRKELNKNNKKVYIICICVSFLAIAISIVLTNKSRKSVTVPVRKLCDLTTKVSKGDFTARYEEENLEKIEEIDVLTKSFNDMAQKIGILIENIKIQEKELHVMELKLLQAQVNPHFLYNTLDTIVWLAEDNQGESVVEMVTALSDFFRTTLSNGKDFITVEEEELHIRSYLQIQQFRYQNIVDYEIHINKEVKEYVVPKLLFQPLIENALYHGIKNKRGKGIIRISGEKTNEFIIFKVADTGKGIHPELLSKLQESISMVDNVQKEYGYGLVNISRRLKYYYGIDSSMEIESKENEGTEVTIKIKI